MLIYEDKIPQSYRSAFVAKVIDISNKLNINPNWLMMIMYFESNKTFSPSVTNPYTGAVGLIQFMPNTAAGLGTSVLQLSKMTAVQQLDYVYKYFAQYKGKIKSYVDLYLATFFPLAIGKDDNFIIQTSNLSASLIASQNPVFDLNKDNKITVGEITQVMLSKVPANWREIFEKKKDLSLVSEQSSFSESDTQSSGSTVKVEPKPKINIEDIKYRRSVKLPKETLL